MTLNRRGFLGALISACAAPAIIRSGVLMPVKPALIVPELIVPEIEEVEVAGNTLLTPSMITRQALIILHQKLNFITQINQTYDDSLMAIGQSLRIRLPQTYAVT